jgi:uncharacterized protein DUF3987
MSREEIIAANPIVEFVRDRGHELKPAGLNFVTNGCPVTEHRKKWHRPVGIDVKKQLWFCNDCKLGGTVIDWVMREKRCDAAQAMRELGGGGNDKEERGQIVCAYDYTDESGNLLYQTCRYRPKDFRQRRPDGNRGWIRNLEGVRRVLYRLPEVIAASTICVAEGEKDCDNLVKLGFVATTNPMGACKWRDEYSETLRGKDVVVFGDVGDDDGAGERHTNQVIESLVGKAKSIKHVALLDGFHDVSDYIASLPHETARETIRRLIDETPEIDLTAGEPLKDGELDETPSPPPPPSYFPPPLGLLPSQLQKYVHAAADSLNVDVAYPFLPLLSSLGSAIGNSRSIVLKKGFIQPPVIWTGIIGPTGTLKSPALEAGWSPVLEYERELKRQNQQAVERFEEDIASWKSEKPKQRGPEPEKLVVLTCLMDDLTIEVLSDRLATNPHGVLVAKDEISHWFASFDQYKSGAKGSDVSRWLSLHTGVFLAVDRRKDNLHHRIWNPRVCITGGIQPKVLRRVLTEEFFERGLPARFLFAYPWTRQPRWSEKTVSDELQNKVLELFADLWLLQPEHDEHGQARPKLLSLDDEAKQIFVAFYNECGAAAVEAAEHDAAAWCKLSGYAARLALVGQLARDPNAKVVTGAVMQAACELARWSGNETTRIYAALAETQEQRERRELIEFVERRGGAVYEREVMQSFTRLKNNKLATARELTALVTDGLGNWESVDHGGGPGRPARKFRLFRLSTSTQSPNSPSVASNSVDVDAPNSQKNEGPCQPAAPCHSPRA